MTGRERDSKSTDPRNTTPPGGTPGKMTDVSTPEKPQGKNKSVSDKWFDALDAYLADGDPEPLKDFYENVDPNRPQ